MTDTTDSVICPNVGNLYSYSFPIWVSDKKWKYCPECGKELGGEWKYCTECGNNIQTQGHWEWPTQTYYPYIIPHTDIIWGTSTGTITSGNMCSVGS